MPVPEIVTGAVGMYVGAKFDRDFLIAGSLAIIVFYILVRLAEKVG